MDETRRLAVFLVLLSGVVGVGVGLVGHVTVGWASTQFLAAAGGESPERFGPVFVALVFFQTTATVFVLGTTLSALLGALGGSRLPNVREALVVGAGGGGAGYYVMALSALLVLSLVGGRGTAQTYDLGQALGPLALSGLPAIGVGAVGAVLGSKLAG